MSHLATLAEAIWVTYLPKLTPLCSVRKRFLSYKKNSLLHIIREHYLKKIFTVSFNCMTSYINNRMDETMPIFKITNKETNDDKITNDDKTINSDKVINDERTNEDKIVVIEGSLSKVFTEALNKAYAIESTYSMLEDIYSEENDDNDDKKQKAYVYAIDGDDMDVEGANDVIKHMRLALDEKYDRIVLAIENVSKVTDSLSMVDSYCSESNIDVIYNFNKAVMKL